MISPKVFIIQWFQCTLISELFYQTIELLVEADWKSGT